MGLKETPEEKLIRIRNILDTLDRMIKNPHWQSTIGVDELRRRAIEKIREIVG